MMKDPRYPIGKPRLVVEWTPRERADAVEEIRIAPDRLSQAVAGLEDRQLDTPYREGGWTMRQVVHHLPDSHLNAYSRFKLALTEDEPLVKTFEESKWAELADSKVSIDMSLSLLESLHQRWVATMVSMSSEQWSRTLRHPDLGILSLVEMLGLYSWHGRHHIAHITRLRDSLGWNWPTEKAG